MSDFLLTTFAMLATLGLTDPTGGVEKPEAPPTDFKLVISLSGASKSQSARLEVLVQSGRAYQFDPGPPLEVAIFDARASRVELLNVRSVLRSEVSLKRLEEYRRGLHDAIEKAAAKREALGGRGNLLTAAMSRDLINPRFSVQFDEPTRSITLSNPSVEIQGRGEPDSDQSRLSYLHRALNALTILDSAQDPRGLPPFSHLSVLQEMMGQRKLRPTEIDGLYRLAGPPRRMRWTFQWEEGLGESQLKAIARVDALKSRARYVRFDQYREHTERQRARESEQPDIKR